MTKSTADDGLEMIELRLDLAQPLPGVAARALDRVVRLEITISRLAKEHPRDPEALSKLYSPALAVDAQGSTWDRDFVR